MTNTSWTERCQALAPTLIEACTTTQVSAGPQALVKEISQRIPDLAFRRVLCRGGWYRLGGVVNSQGESVAEDLEAWVSGEADAREGDIAHLYEDYAGKGLFATRLVGRTHYLVSTTGNAPDDFLQLEVEDLQEIRSHPLFGDDDQATSVEDIIDPRQSEVDGHPVGLPYYTFRRVTHIGEILARMRSQSPEPQAIHRFVEDWGKSSAGHATTLPNHWVIVVREHLDRFHQPIFQAQPVAALTGDLPRFRAAQGTARLAMHDALQTFDREAGYPMAWFFHMLTSKAVPTWVAQTVVEDALSGYAYLPQRDVDVVRHWLHRSYAF